MILGIDDHGLGEPLPMESREKVDLSSKLV